MIIINSKDSLSRMKHLLKNIFYVDYLLDANIVM